MYVLMHNDCTMYSRDNTHSYKAYYTCKVKLNY